MTQTSMTSFPSGAQSRLRVFGAGALVPVIGALVMGALIGCGPTPESVEPPPPPPTAEERFDNIIGALEDKLNDGSFGTADAVSEYDAPTGTPITAAKVEVKHSLTPPEGEGGVHHAQLCLITKAKVTVTLPTKSSINGDDDAAEANPRRKKVEQELRDEGLPSMDSLIVPSREEAASRLGSSGVHEIDSGDTERCFELEFREGQWVLVSEVDKVNEPFNALAIEYALKKQ